MKVCVFSYGSNMCRERIRNRVPSAQPVETGFLARHSLRFHKRGRDGSGKADAFRTGNGDDRVWGVLVEIEPAEKAVLDRFESLGVGYDQKRVPIITAAGDRREAFVYVARSTMIDRRLRPFHWYKRFLLVGARQHGLPPFYLARLQKRRSVPDADLARRRVSQRILGGDRPR